MLAISRMPQRSLLTLVVAGSLLACVSCGGDDPKPAAGGQTATPAPAATAAAATLPGRMFPSQGNDHLVDAAQPHLPYNSDPPTSGPHLPPLQRPGVYTQPFAPQALPHFMEHGGVWVLYNCPAGCDADLTSLQSLVNRAASQGRPAALAPYPLTTGRFAVAAWQYLLTLDTLDPAQIERFVEQHACRYNPEGGPYCTGVRGQILPSQTPPPGR